MNQTSLTKFEIEELETGTWTKKEMNKKEGEYMIELKPEYNLNIAGRGTGSEYRELMKVELAAKTKKWRSQNLERAAEAGKAWRNKNTEHIKEKSKAWRIANKETVAIKQQAYHKLHPAVVDRTKVNAYRKAHYVVNKEAYNEKLPCECGGKYSKTHKSRHEKSNRHQAFIAEKD
jgi:hypothetical protein